MFCLYPHRKGDDQCLLTKSVFGDQNDWQSRQMNTTRLKVWGINETDPNCGNHWFFYQRFFAKPVYYKCPVERMSIVIENYND